MIIDVNDRVVSAFWELLRIEEPDMFARFRAQGVTDEDAVNFMLRNFFQVLHTEVIRDTDLQGGSYRVNQYLAESAETAEHRKAAYTRMKAYRRHLDIDMKTADILENILSELFISSIDKTGRGPYKK